MGLLNFFPPARFFPNVGQGLLGSSEDEDWGGEGPLPSDADLPDSMPPVPLADSGLMPLRLTDLAYTPDLGGAPRGFLAAGEGEGAGGGGGAAQPATPALGTDVLTDGSIKQRIYPNLEHGALSAERVRAIVLHRTAGPTAASALEAWKTKPEGTHFLIDNDGTIYQTAGLDKSTWHVGPIRSRAEDEEGLTPAEKDRVAQARATGARADNSARGLSRYELTKEYPNRYPGNGDSIGIEVVGDYLRNLEKKERAFVPPTQAQRESVAKLVEALKARFGLKSEDVYHHADISYKDENRTEGKGLGY